MPAFAGVGAAVKEGATPTAFNEASKWTLNVKAGTKDVTPMGAAGGWGVNASTVKTFSGTVSAFFDNSDTAQTDMVSLIGQTVSMQFFVNGTNKFTATCLITEFDPTVDASDVVKCDYKFVNGSGALSYA